MRILPISSQKRAFANWIFGIGCWFRMRDSWALSEILDKMVFMLKKSAETKDREGRDLIGRKLRTQRIERYKKLANKGDYVVIGKKRLFGLLELYYSQSKGGGFVGR